MNSYLIINVKGNNIYRFINKCKTNNILLYNIKYISYKEVIIKISDSDYSKLLKIRSLYKYKVINKRGFIKLKDIFYNYKLLIILFIIGLFFLLYLSNIIFSVHIITDNKKLKKLISKELEYYDIKKYSFSKSYNEIQNIKKKILNKNKNNIEWLEIDRKGTLYEVQVVERKKNKKSKKKKMSNIIAKKSGVIKNIFVTSGIKMVEKDSYVSKGDIIISGIIKNNDDIKGLTEASGKVYAEVWYNINVEYPLIYTEKKYTNNYRKSFYFKIGNKYFERKRYNLFKRNKNIFYKSKIVPFEFGIDNQNEVKKVKQNLSITEAKKKAILKAKEKLLYTLEKDEYIISEKTLKFYEKNSKIIIDVFFTCFEEIGKKEIIE